MLRPFDQIPAFRTGGLDKRVRIRRVKERKERVEEREVNKVSCSFPVRALWPVVHIRRRPKTTGSQLWLLGLVHWQASWPLSTPSGRDVSCTEEESPPESPFVAGRRTPFQGPKLGSCLTLGNELSKETHVLTKQEISLGKGTQVESSRINRNPGEQLFHWFYGDGISFQVVFSQSSDPESFLVVYTLFSQDGCQREGFWEVVGHVVSPFDLA